MSNLENEVFDWDDEVEGSEEYELLENGDYKFEVVAMEKEWFEPKNPATSKIPACNQACVQIQIIHNGKKHIIFHRMKLTLSLKWLICQFFESIGLREKGDTSKSKFQWDSIVGKTGVAAVIKSEYNGKERNEISKFYSAVDAPKVTSNSEEDDIAW